MKKIEIAGGPIGELSNSLQTDSIIWRIVFEGKQLLSEVNTWDLPTIYDANDMLIMKNDMSSAFTQASMEINNK